ncbi:MAG: alanine dehydrogenase [Thalassotalea sp.]
MIIGVPKEIKNHEYRVGLTPASVKELVIAGHEVLVENNAGQGIGLSDQDYIDVGASISDKHSLFQRAKLIIKVKEPLLSEVDLIQADQIIFTYLHLAANKELTLALLAKNCICIAYETVSDHHGGLPLLQPMSAVAGRIAIQAGAKALEKSNHGAGILLGGVPGVEAANVVIIGGGIVGNNAAQMAVGLEAKVTILDRNTEILKSLSLQFGNKIQTIYSTTEAISHYVKQADLLIGSVLIPGASAPKLVTLEHIKSMKPGSAVVDVAIDQGGCFETSIATTHADPIYVKHGVVHYCVTNMPGAVPKTATSALNNATLPYILKLAGHNINQVLTGKGMINTGLLSGVNIYQGAVTNKQVANSLAMPFVDLNSLINIP